MIIQCRNCSRKFFVKDEDIPKEGRMVQCSNCSQKWFQAPIKIKKSIKSDIGENVSKTQFDASDGRTYKFMGSQWAELLRSGKTGLVARKTIAAELNRKAGIAKPQKSRKRIKKTEEVKIEDTTKIIDPSSEQIDSDDQQKKGLGFFSYIILLTIITLSIIGILKTFQNELIMYFPETEYIFDKGENIFESMGYIITLIKNLIISY